MTREESWLRRRRSGCQVFIAEKRAEEEEANVNDGRKGNSGIISYVTATCRGNIHDMGIVTARRTGMDGDDLGIPLTSGTWIRISSQRTSQGSGFALTSISSG
jgi:hypothetical protein